jgi:hypothetical protein
VQVAHKLGFHHFITDQYVINCYQRSKFWQR